MISRNTKKPRAAEASRPGLIGCYVREGLVATVVLALIILVEILRGKRDTAKHFSRPRRAKREEMSDVWTCRQSGGRQNVGNLHKVVRVGTVVAIRADSRSDGVDVDRSVSVHLSDSFPLNTSYHWQ